MDTINRIKKSGEDRSTRAMKLHKQELAKITKARSIERQCLFVELGDVFEKLKKDEKTWRIEQLLNNKKHIRFADSSSSSNGQLNNKNNNSNDDVFPANRIQALFKNVSSTPLTSSSSLQATSEFVSPSFQADTYVNRAQSIGDNTLQVNILPGWFKITDDIDGFDESECTGLSNKPVLLGIESEALHSIKLTKDTTDKVINEAQR